MSKKEPLYQVGEIVSIFSFGDRVFGNIGVITEIEQTYTNIYDVLFLDGSGTRKFEENAVNDTNIDFIFEIDDIINVLLTIEEEIKETAGKTKERLDDVDQLWLKIYRDYLDVEEDLEDINDSYNVAFTSTNKSTPITIMFNKELLDLDIKKILPDDVLVKEELIVGAYFLPVYKTNINKFNKFEIGQIIKLQQKDEKLPDFINPNLKVSLTSISKNKESKIKQSIIDLIEEVKENYKKIIKAQGSLNQRI